MPIQNRYIDIRRINLIVPDKPENALFWCFAIITHQAVFITLALNITHIALLEVSKMNHDSCSKMQTSLTELTSRYIHSIAQSSLHTEIKQIHSASNYPLTHFTTKAYHRKTAQRHFSYIYSPSLISDLHKYSYFISHITLHGHT